MLSQEAICHKWLLSESSMIIGLVLESLVKMIFLESHQGKKGYVKKGIYFIKDGFGGQPTTLSYSILTEKIPNHKASTSTVPDKDQQSPQRRCLTSQQYNLSLSIRVVVYFRKKKDVPIVLLTLS